MKVFVCAEKFCYEKGGCEGTATPVSSVGACCGAGGASIKESGYCYKCNWRF